MAATTSGWQWPVELTAIPAAKSRNSLPSTSVMRTPRPLLANSGHDRVYLGEMSRPSASTAARAFGPGTVQTSLGPYCACNSCLVMVQSPRQILLCGRRGMFKRMRRGHGSHCEGSSSSTRPGGREIEGETMRTRIFGGPVLVAAEETRSSAGGQHTQVLARADDACARPRPPPTGL